MLTILFNDFRILDARSSSERSFAIISTRIDDVVVYDRAMRNTCRAERVQSGRRRSASAAGGVMTVSEEHRSVGAHRAEFA
jgi:hypothetical protein